LCGPDDADDPSKKQSKDIVYHELYTNAGELEKLKSAASDSSVYAGREALETEERKDKEQQTKDRLRGLKKKGLVFTAKDINFDKKSKLGKGNFGSAWLCNLKNADKTEVVLKIPHHRGVTEADWAELSAAIKLKPHRNVLNLIGLLYRY